MPKKAADPEKKSKDKKKKLAKVIRVAEVAAPEVVEAPAAPVETKPKKTAKAAKPARKAAKPAKVVARKKPVVISNEDIALRAYYIAERRQNLGWPGDSTSDWIEAERQLKAEAAKAR